ncbi:MAG: hypothetical protein E6J90_12360 [Deltaproteobacteria bacterium]|nr:MAG: hypothetical protein E6J90_12360 [Deltaproteobacteria bacterium]
MQPRHRARLADQPRPRDVVAVERGVQHLERDRAIEVEVAGFPHHAHPAGAEHALEPVLAEPDARREQTRRRRSDACGAVVDDGRSIPPRAAGARQHELDIEQRIELAAPVSNHPRRR